MFSIAKMLNFCRVIQAQPANTKTHAADYNIRCYTIHQFQQNCDLAMESGSSLAQLYKQADSCCSTEMQLQWLARQNNPQTVFSGACSRQLQHFTIKETVHVLRINCLCTSMRTQHLGPASKEPRPPGCRCITTAGTFELHTANSCKLSQFQQLSSCMALAPSRQFTAAAASNILLCLSPLVLRCSRAENIMNTTEIRG
jgi:hypothetical protein